jgi:hypothetical protein
MSSASSATKPDALLLLTSTCPHCPAVLAGLSDLVKQGHIGRLEVVNIGLHPEIAEHHGVRSVPWVRLGPFELEGLRSPAEFRQWAERADSTEGMAEYFRELLKSGQLAKVTALVRDDGAQLKALLNLLADPDLEITIRIGISAVFEELEGFPALLDTIDTLAALTLHPDAHIRADAAHLLSLTHNPRAGSYIERLLTDDVADVREIARESLERLRNAAASSSH